MAGNRPRKCRQQDAIFMDPLFLHKTFYFMITDLMRDQQSMYVILESTPFFKTVVVASFHGAQDVWHSLTTDDSM